MSYRKKHIKTKINKLKKPQKPIIKRPFFRLVFLLLIFFVFTFYFFIFSSYFKIEKIIIFGSEKVQIKDINNFVLERINKKIFDNIFLVDIKKLNKEILNSFHSIESVKIKKIFPQTIIVEIEDRKIFGAFCGTLNTLEITEPSVVEERCFLIDKNGIIFELLSNASENMIVLRNPLDIDIKKAFVGEKVVAENIIDIILKIEKNLKDNLQINVKEAVLSNPLRLNIKTGEKWEVYFDLNSDVDAQIIKMNSLLSSGEISVEARKNLQYIDLRFKDKAYYK